MGGQGEAPALHQRHRRRARHPALRDDLPEAGPEGADAVACMGGRGDSSACSTGSRASRPLRSLRATSPTRRSRSLALCSTLVVEASTTTARGSGVVRNEDGTPRRQSSGSRNTRTVRRGGALRGAGSWTWTSGCSVRAQTATVAPGYSHAVAFLNGLVLVKAHHHVAIGLASFFSLYF